MGRKKIHLTKTCVVCNKQFEPRQPDGRLNRTIKVCSASCRGTLGGQGGRGKITPPHVREKIRIAQLREKGNNWKGGTWLSQPQSERKSARYKSLVKAVMARDGYACVKCGVSGVYLEVHHIKSYANHIELRFDMSNLETLCKPCHRATESFGKG